MLGLELIRWWYAEGWLRLVRLTYARIQAIALIFSLPLLVRTLFAPWRRIISYGEGSISERFRAMLDNLISRLVGAAVRLLVILTAVIGIVGVSLVGALLIILWPLLPLLGIGLIVRGVAL